MLTILQVPESQILNCIPIFRVSKAVHKRSKTELSDGVSLCILIGL